MYLKCKYAGKLLLHSVVGKAKIVQAKDITFNDAIVVIGVYTYRSLQ